VVRNGYMPAWDLVTGVYDFPASHWVHISTTNPIESTYATVRLRTKIGAGGGKTWRGLIGHEQIALVMAGKTFIAAKLQVIMHVFDKEQFGRVLLWSAGRLDPIHIRVR
jgi:hypothetical protein